MLPKPTKIILVAILILMAFTGFSQEFTSFTRNEPSYTGFRYQNNLKGDLTFIGNNILNRAEPPSIGPNDPYNNQNVRQPRPRPTDYFNTETGGYYNYNDFKDMRYINIDPANTFSSSSATLALEDPSCSRIRYAGLYWSATYPRDNISDPVGTPRQHPINQVRLSKQGGAYVPVIADDVIFDGLTSTALQSNAPYVSYADVTDIVRGPQNPDGSYNDPSGVYIVADIPAAQGTGTPLGGASGGWTLVIAYENPSLPGKLITTYDGFAWVQPNDDPSTTLDERVVPINYSGFETIPVGPVNADIGSASLEGDFALTGDFMRIRSASNTNFTPVQEASGNLDNNNFFNSDITLDGVITTNRNPNSTNTLGFDSDMFRMSNPASAVIPNGETAATFEYRTNGDSYYPFFNSFNIEIIEPNIVLKKKVFLPDGSAPEDEITGQGVNLGQTLDYLLYFQNIGNDDATGIDPSNPDYQSGDSPMYVIRDILPINVTLNEAYLSANLLPGITYTYEPATRTVMFFIPDNYVNKDDPEYSIRMRVKVAENCFDFIDACTDIIRNVAYSTYAGVINDYKISDDPSVTEFDTCGYVVPGATNFLLDDLSACNFERTVELCGGDILLDAGDGFAQYRWFRDENGNNLLDETIDTPISDGDPDNDGSTIIVNAVGTYIVDKMFPPDPCKGFKEIIHVVPYGAGLLPNPIIEYFNTVNNDSDTTNDLAGEIVQCSIDQDFLPKLFLCGANDSRLLQVNIIDAQSIVWEKLVEGSCDSTGDDCANKNLTCSWTSEGTGNNYDLDSPGKYRLQVTYQNGCTSRFYFNVFQNNLDIPFTKQDIICTTPGNITVTTLGNGYAYRLVDSDTGAVIQPFSPTRSFDFNSGENGTYRVEVVQLDNNGNPIAGSCIFSTEPIGVLERNVTYAINVTNASCTGFGSINLQINNADPDYEYEIRLDDGSNGGQGTLVDNETAQPDNNFTFNGLNPGDYIAIARTDDGCEYSEQVTIVDENDLELEARVSQHITCREGNILMSSEGGRPPHTYAIWSYVDNGGNTVISYSDPTDIPASEYQTSQIFDILDPGFYTFVVVDRTNCFAYSNTVEIEFRPAAEFNPTSVVDVLCFGDSSGIIEFNLVDDNGYQLTYYLFDGATFDENDYDPINALASNSSGYFPGLAAGEYDIVINQRKGSASCDYLENHTITTPTNALAADAFLIQDYTCAQDGIIEAQNVVGGTAPYSYSIDGVNFIPDTTPNAHRFENLTDGDYTITVRDANGCTFPTNTITINPRNEPSDLTFVATQPICPSLTSDVTVSVTDGNTPFNYEIILPVSDAIDNGTSSNFVGLSPGTYTFRVTDDKNCTIEESYTINPITPIAVSGQLNSNITCFGLTDGALTFNVDDFATSYDYSVTGPATFNGTSETANSIPLTGLAPGTYTITVTDNDTNCTATTDVTIAAPPAALVISELDVTDISCSTTGTNPGSVVITATDGWGGYEYELEDPTGGTVGPQSTNSFTGLTDTTGNYTVTVRDAGGCEVTQTFALTPAIAPVLEVTANSLCYDSTNGLTLTANVTSGGEAPFQYRLGGGGAYQSNPVFSGLAPGSYTVEVIDNKNCTASDTIDVFPTLTASANLVKDTDCSATPDAEISITISGGNPTFTYEVFRDGGSVQASTTVPSIPFSYFTLTAGSYEFLITDAENCTVTTNQVLVTVNTPPTAVEVITQPLCTTSADGIAELQISGGAPPYQIVFDGSAPSSQTIYSGLSAGTYTYTVTDSKGCVLSDDVTLTAPSALIPGTIDVVQDYRCDNTSATLQVINYSGGTPGYTFSIDGVNFQPSDTFSTGITDGSYTITVRDANGCVEQTPIVVIDPLNPPTDLVFSQTSPVCPAIVSDVTVNVVDGNAPFTYEITAPSGSVVNNGNNNTFIGLSPGTYTFLVTDSKGCSIQESYTVADIPRVDVLSQLTSDVSCFGLADGEFTFTVSDFSTTYSYTVENSSATVVQNQNNINLLTPIVVSGLVADTYTVTVTDDTTNCTATTVTTISGPPAALDFTFTNTPVTCTENSTITVTPTGGWGSYEYQLENTAGPSIVYAYQGNNVFTNVAAGTYTIYVRDSGGCIEDKPITINPSVAPTIALNATSDFCYDSIDQASLVIDVTDGIGPYSYSIDGGDQITAVGNPFTISNLIPGTYSIQVTDAFGCISNVLNETIATQLTASTLVSKALDCSVSPDAIIDVTISNGYTPYATYEVSSDGGTTWGTPVAIVGNTFSHSTAAAGTYDFRITDNRNCIVIAQAIVDPITSPDITSLVQITDILCNGDSGAAIQVNLDNTQGVAPFAISVLNTTTATNYGTQTSGLPAGTYEVTVTDSKSCTDMEVIVISEPDPITYAIMLTDIQCDSAGTDPSDNTIPGSISVSSVAGGTVEYTYYLTANNGMPTQTYTTSPGNLDHTFTILNFGIYYVEIIDANGCSVTSNEIIASPPDDLDIDVSTVTTNCAAGGTAIVSVSSAFSSNDYEFAVLEYFSPPYSNNYQGPDVVNGDTATITGLIPGTTYTFVVFDNATKCYYFETADSPIDTPSNLTWSIDEVSNVSCTGSSDGAVSFSFDNYAGDASSVSYEIYNFQSNITTGIATGSPATVNPPAVGTGVSVTDLGPLGPGVYYILFTENGGANAGCSVASEEFTIEEASVQLVANASLEKNDNCNLNAGVVSASGQFGRAPYEFQIALATDLAPTATTWAGSATNVFNVEGGNYILYVKDAFDCIQSDAIVVPTDPDPEITVVVNDQCIADEGNFSVDIILDVPGAVPHSISIDGGAPQAATGLIVAGDRMTIGNLTSGPHTFALIDQNGCSDTDPITIYPPLSITANISSGENCNPANSGEVTVTASGGSGNYSYSQITPVGPTNTTGVFTGLTHSVAYTFELLDTTTNCTAPVTITLPQPAIPSFTLAKTDISCNSGSDGTITVTLDSGNIDTPYLYSLDGGTTTQPSNVFNGLTQGTYSVTVISDKGCADTESISLIEPSQLNISASRSDFSCDDAASTITVVVNNDGTGNPSGTGPYVYSFDNGANFQAANTYQVPFGSPNVTVVVRDSNGCTDDDVVIIPIREEVTATITADAPMDCTDNQQVISINASNGSGTYTYTELPSGNLIADPTNITLTQPGTYIYEVLDTVTNCSVTVEHTVAPYDLIEVTAVVTTNATCSDSTDGVIEVTLTGYTGTFNYQVLDGSGAFVAGASGTDNAISDPYVFNTAASLGAGLFSVQITETAFPNCVGASNQVTIDAPEPLAIQLIDNVNANCNEANAIVTVQATGGTGPYSYGASQRGAGDSGVYPFDYTIELDPTTNLDWDIYVRDANNCVISVPYEISVDTDTTPDIALTIDDECAAEGSFDIIVSLDAVNFGVAPYIMSLDGNAFESIPSFPHTYSNLSAGNHSVVIRDVNGCGELESIIIDPELLISAIVVMQPTCSANDGVIEFAIIGGDASNTVMLLNAGTMTDTGLVPSGNQFTGVGFGDYIVRVTDTPLTPSSCIAEAPISLEEPTPVTLLATDWTDVSCFGASDGTITINLEPSNVGVNDNPPYTFEITDGTSTFTQNTYLFTDLTAGIWDITVTSNRNCIATDQVTIDEPTALAAAVTNVIPFACDANNAQQAAVIEVTITSGTGTPDYFFSVNGNDFLPTGGLVFTYDALTAGSYDFVIRDARGCLFTIPTEVIDPLNVFTATVTQDIAITCDPSTNEQVTITVADDGNPHTYTYELLPVGNPNGSQTATTGNTATFELTAVGSYTFRVTDTATGCYVDTDIYDIAPYDLIEVTAQALDPVICFGDNNGSFSLNVTGYSGTYDYEIFDSAGTSILGPIGSDTSVNPRVIGGLSGGNYYVTVTETDPTSTLCSDDSNTFTIVSPDMPLTEITTPLSNVTCADGQGEASVVPDGGYPPYDIVLTNTTTGQVYPPANDVQAMVFTALSAGDYSVQVTDNNNCVITNLYPNLFMLPTRVDGQATPLVTNLACFGDTNGTVTAINVINGSGSYEYQLNYYDDAGTNIEFTTGEQLSDTFSGLGAGIYSITITDGWNCDMETNQVTITEPTSVSASLIRTNPLTCEDGVEFELTAMGGSGSYEYSADNTNWFAMTSNPMPLPESGTLGPATHQYYVRDVAGCDAVASNAITEDPIIPLELSEPTHVDVACNGEATGSIFAEASFGMGNYEYSLFTDAALTTNYYGLGHSQPTGQFNNLPAGQYYVSVVSGDCGPVAQPVEIEELEPLSFTVDAIDVLCFGDETGSITITPSGGAGGYIYSISPNLDQFDTINVFDELAPGDYQIIAQDQNGCFEFIEVTIGAPEPLSATGIATPEICEGEENGTIEITIQGGTAPYSTRLSSESNFVQDRVSFIDMAAGGYIIFVRDANGCEYDLGVTIDPGVNLNATVEPVYECTGDSPDNYVNITLEDSTVQGDVLYALDSTDPNDLQLNPDFRNSAPGDHYIRIAHSNGCFLDIPFEIEGFEPLTLVLEQNSINEITAIAQGGVPDYTFYFDDINNGTDNTYRINRSDTYVVRVLDQNGCEAIAEIEMEFIDIEIPNFFTPDGDGLNDRWLPENIEGWPEILIKIYDRYGRVVEDDVVDRNGWDGLYNKDELPTGDYWYVIKLNGENDDREFVGHFTLYR